MDSPWGLGAISANAFQLRAMPGRCGRKVDKDRRPGLELPILAWLCAEIDRSCPKAADLGPGSVARRASNLGAQRRVFNDGCWATLLGLAVVVSVALSCLVGLCFLSTQRPHRCQAVQRDADAHAEPPRPIRRFQSSSALPISCTAGSSYERCEDSTDSVMDGGLPILGSGDVRICRAKASTRSTGLMPLISCRIVSIDSFFGLLPLPLPFVCTCRSSLSSVGASLPLDHVLPVLIVIIPHVVSHHLGLCSWSVVCPSCPRPWRRQLESNPTHWPECRTIHSGSFLKITQQIFPGVCLEQFSLRSKTWKVNLYSTDQICPLFAQTWPTLAIC